MIIILFISLAIVFYLVQYFENRRKQRNDEHHERRRESFTNLLNSLSRKAGPDDPTEKKEHET